MCPRVESVKAIPPPARREFVALEPPARVQEGWHPAMATAFGEDMEQLALACQGRLSSVLGAAGLSDGCDPARPVVAAQAPGGPARGSFAL